MRLELFHISEQSNIKVFRPRRSKAIWGFERCVWAISESHVHNYYLPRACPRICIRAKDLHFSLPISLDANFNPSTSYVFTSDKWRDKINSTALYQYEFDPKSFQLKDAIAGYYVSLVEQVPKNVSTIRDIPIALVSKNVQLYFLRFHELQSIREGILKTTNQFSIIKWRNLKAE